MNQAQTPEDYFISCFEPLTPEAREVLKEHTRLTCIKCGKAFQIIMDDPHRVVCGECGEKGEGKS